MTRSILKSALALGAVGVATAALSLSAAAPSAAARTGTDGQSLVCVNLMNVGGTPVIDDHTILMQMKAGKVHYKRISLAGPCPDIDFNGFSYPAEAYNEICSSDPLSVRAVPGEICKISSITDISDDEAKALMAKKNHKHD